jgi:hypothetical protein
MSFYLLPCFLGCVLQETCGFTAELRDGERSRFQHLLKQLQGTGTRVKCPASEWNAEALCLREPQRMRR